MQGFSNFTMEVPNHFVPQINTLYRVVSVKEPSKAFTVIQGKHRFKLCISEYLGDPSQKFTFFTQGNKFAFVSQSSNTALYIPEHKQHNGAHIVTDAGQHPSNWFDIVKVTTGDFANRGYHIISNSGRALDLDGSNTNNGNKIIQWEMHNNWSQIWLIVPADKPISQNAWGNEKEHGHHHHKHGSHGEHKQKTNKPIQPPTI